MSKLIPKSEFNTTWIYGYGRNALGFKKGNGQTALG